jgi:RNA polymerase sigma-70 factor (ECF subfamily)
MADLMPLASGNPELDHLRGLYRAEFKSALEEAISSLDPDERKILRNYYYEGLGVERLGVLYNVDTRTAGRRIARARAKILSTTRRRLMAKLGLGRAELESILRAVRSGLEISAGALFR